MKKIELHRLALLGITSGIIALSQGSLEGFEDHHSIDMNHLIAKPSCKNRESCGSATELAPKLNADEDLADKESTESKADEKKLKEKKKKKKKVIDKDDSVKT